MLGKKGGGRRGEANPTDQQCCKLLAFNVLLKGEACYCLTALKELDRIRESHNNCCLFQQPQFGAGSYSVIITLFTHYRVYRLGLGSPHHILTVYSHTWMVGAPQSSACVRKGFQISPAPFSGDAMVPGASYCILMGCPGSQIMYPQTIGQEDGAAGKWKIQIEHRTNGT